MYVLHCRSFGPSPSTWNLWPFFLSCSWSARPVKRKPSPATTCLPWGPTELCTSSTGSTDTTSKDSLTSLQWWPELCRPYCTVISSICILPRVSQVVYWEHKATAFLPLSLLTFIYLHWYALN